MQSFLVRNFQGVAEWYFQLEVQLMPNYSIRTGKKNSINYHLKGPAELNHSMNITLSSDQLLYISTKTNDLQDLDRSHFN